MGIAVCDNVMLSIEIRESLPETGAFPVGKDSMNGPGQNKSGCSGDFAMDNKNTIQGGSIHAAEEMQALILMA